MIYDTFAFSLPQSGARKQCHEGALYIDVPALERLPPSRSEAVPVNTTMKKLATRVGEDRFGLRNWARYGKYVADFLGPRLPSSCHPESCPPNDANEALGVTADGR